MLWNLLFLILKCWLNGWQSSQHQYVWVQVQKSFPIKKSQLLRSGLDYSHIFLPVTDSDFLFLPPPVWEESLQIILVHTDLLSLSPHACRLNANTHNATDAQIDSFTNVCTTSCPTPDNGHQQLQI